MYRFMYHLQSSWPREIVTAVTVHLKEFSAVQRCYHFRTDSLLERETHTHRHRHTDTDTHTDRHTYMPGLTILKK